MNKTVLTVLALIVLAGIGYYLWTASDAAEPAGSDATNTDTTSGMRVEENAVAAFDQKPGANVQVSQVYLATPGYVIIHEDNAGAPGAIIGTSALLPAGESDNVFVPLSRDSKEGERLYAMVHLEADGNGQFSAADAPAPSVLGGPIMGFFMISSEADAPGAITL